MRPHFERALQPLSELPGTASWYALGGAWLCAAVLVAALGRQDWQLCAVTRSTEDSALRHHQSSGSDALSQLLVASGQTERVDFSSTLPGFADPDTTIRFTSRLAQDQDVHVSQMQSEGVATDARKLGQTKFTLQLRGDYLNIKNVTIGLLSKFPGLTLQRLTMHHRDANAASPTDKSNDEATLELVQFSRPATTP